MLLLCWGSWLLALVRPNRKNSLKGKAINDEVADQASWAAVADATPLSQNAYKEQLARVAVKRALLTTA